MKNKLFATSYFTILFFLLCCATTGRAQCPGPITLDAINNWVKAERICTDGTRNSDGYIRVSVDPPNYAYRFNLSNGDSSGRQSSMNTFYGLSAGSYNLTVSYADYPGCPSVVFHDSVATFALAPISLGGYSLIDSETVCSDGTGLSNGGALFNPIGDPEGNNNFSYDWGGFPSAYPNSSFYNNALSNVPSGIYDVYVSDQDNYCPADLIVVIIGAKTLSPIFLISSNTSPEIICGGGLGNANGRDSLTLTGGAGTYQADWFNGSGYGSSMFIYRSGSSTNSISSGINAGLSAGIYTVLVSDATYPVCPTLIFSDTVGSVLSSSLPPLTISSVSTTPEPLCNNGLSTGHGSTTIHINGGMGLLKFKWSTGDSSFDYSTSSIYNLRAGIYTVTVSDGSIPGCRTAVFSDTVGSTTLTPITVIHSGALPQTFCSGGPGAPNGRPYAVVSGGSGTYLWLWSDGQYGSGNYVFTPNLVTAGVYTVTVVDENNTNCPIITIRDTVGSDTIAPLTLVRNIVIPTGQCFANGRIDLTVHGGFGNGFYYSWSTGEAYYTDSSTGMCCLNAGIYSVTVETGDGNVCPALVVSDTVLSIMPTFIDSQTVCQGMSYIGHNTSGTYTDTLTTGNGCDSIRILHLTVLNSMTSTVNTSLCSGSSYAGHTASGVYTDHYTSASGCDSARTLNLTVNPGVTWYLDGDGDGYYAATQVSCNSPGPLWNTTSNLGTDCDDNSSVEHTSFNFFVDNDGDGYGTGSLVSVCAIDAFTAPSGYALNNTDCDDNSSVKHASFAFYVDNDGDGFGTGLPVSICAIDANTAPSGYSFNNLDCDDNNSTVTGLPTVSRDPSNHTTCEGQSVTFISGRSGSAASVHWQVSTDGGLTFSDISVSAYDTAYTSTPNMGQNGNRFRAIYTNACGSDTTTAAALTVIANVTIIDTVTICTGSSYAGHTQAGTYTDHYISAAACDSTKVLILFMTNAITSSLNVYICAGSSYAGHTASGIYTDHYTSASGCDSARTLNLTVNNAITSNISASTCAGSSYAGHTASGVYTDHYTSASGCDSARTLNLTVSNAITSNISASICAGTSFAGHTASGTYTDHYTSASGCDSARTVNLTINNAITSNISAAICAGSSYAGHTSSGTYTDHYTSVSGCDSARTVILTVKQAATSSVTASISAGQTYTVGTQTLGSTGTYTVTLHAAAVNGCDSIVTLHLSVLGTACVPAVSVTCSNINLDVASSRILTATPVNGGSAAVYNWYFNGTLVANIHGNILSYGGALGNGDQIYCTMAVANGCALGQMATSNAITFTRTGSSAKDIITLTMPAQVGVSVINNINATVSAVVTTAPALRTAIHPTRLFTTVGSSYGPSYAVNRDFSQPVTYTVVAQDGSRKIWTVTVLDQSGNKTNSTSDNLNALNDMNVYPDPATTYINVQATGGNAAPVITILDMAGRVMYQQALPVTDYINHQIDVTAFAAGSYIMYVSVGDAMQTRQFIVGK